jgi:hypothetical protein
VAVVGSADASESRVATPQPSLADALAERAAYGDGPVGIDSDDALRESVGNDEALNVAAVDAAQERLTKQSKWTAPAKQAAQTESESDSDVQPTKRPRAKPPKTPKTTKTKPVEKLEIDSDDDDDDGSKGTSRHKPAKSSALVQKWDGTILAALRKEFQRLVLARDGYPPKCTHGNQEANYRMVLLAGKRTMEPATFKTFKAEMEAAYNSKDKK